MTDVSFHFHPFAVMDLVADPNLGKAISEVATQVAAEVSRLAPRGEGEHLDEHIGTSSGVDGAGVYADVGTTSGRFYYWRFLEFGTDRMAARPFIKPALQRTYTI